MSTLYMWILTFLMPAFIVISGFFARGSSDPNYIAILTKRIFVPYVIFQMLYSGYYYLLGKDNWMKDHLFDPHWSLWFLLSLFFWHLLLILFKKLPPFFGIVIAFGIGIFVGYFDTIGHTFSLSRTFVFFPYFLLGYWTSIEQMRILKKKSSRVASIIILISVAFLIYYVPSVDSDWLLGSKSYNILGQERYGGLIRAMIYLISLLMAFSILTIVPQRSFSFTRLGERTLYVYLLHGFIIQYFRRYQLFQVCHSGSLVQTIVLAVLIVLVTSNYYVMCFMQPFVEVSMSELRALFQNKWVEKF